MACSCFLLLWNAHRNEGRAANNEVSARTSRRRCSCLPSESLLLTVTLSGCMCCTAGGSLLAFDGEARAGEDVDSRRGEQDATLHCNFVGMPSMIQLSTVTTFTWECFAGLLSLGHLNRFRVHNRDSVCFACARGNATVELQVGATDESSNRRFVADEVSASVSAS